MAITFSCPLALYIEVSKLYWPEVIKCWVHFYRLRLVAKESQKTENVDLHKLMSDTKKCSVIITRLIELEINSIRMVNEDYS